MLLSELSGKEIINLHDGAKLGLIGESDITITGDGKIEAIIIASRNGSGRFLGKSSEREGSFVIIPWKAIKKVGSEVIIVDIDYAQLG